ncbi:MAG: type II toxin-antitoxin system RelE/ParE family toxin [Defluviitaleaceae bacterium]|nr:type II toxin-antitoxin system RelE/ParE family toxin [Defluviitaleaceae bacterium]
MYNISYLPRAISDIFGIEDYLSKHSATAANRFAKALDKKVSAIAELPMMHPAYERDSFFRKMVLGDYLLFYSIDKSRKLIVIHRIFHHSQNIDSHMRKYRSHNS